MSEDRETHEIITPAKGHKVILKSWINGREKQAIDGTMFNNIDTVGQGNEMKPKLSSSMITGRENTSIEYVVVSVDGNDSDVLNQVLDMRAKDYEFVLKEVELVTEGNFDEKKDLSLNSNISEPLTAVADESPIVSSIQFQNVQR